MHDQHILQVENNPDDVFRVQQSFRKAGVTATVHTVGDGDAAVAYLGCQPPYQTRSDCPLPSLVLLDLDLPRRSGFEVLTWVRSQPGLRRLPVVVFSSSEEPRDVARAYDAGANSYLVKPVSTEAMDGMAATLSAYWLLLNRRAHI